MRQILILTIGLAIPFATPWIVRAEDAVAKRQIEIKTGDESLVFGRPIPINVSYRNAGVEPWIVKEPGRSPDVLVRYRQPGDMGRPKGYFLGKLDVRTIKFNNEETTFRASPKLAEIQIKPGATHEFTTDLNAHWSGWLVPGRWDVWIADEQEKIESNRLAVKLWFTKVSVTEMLTVARDGEQHWIKRKSHGEWLQKLKPDLKLDWPSIEDPKEMRKQKEPGIQAALKEFATFWEREQDSESMTETIRKFNEAAGLKPPRGKSDESEASKK